MRPLTEVLGNALGFPDTTYAISVSQPGNLVKQADQSLRAQQADLLVVCVRDAGMLDAISRVVPRRVGPGRLSAVVVIVLGREPRLAAILEPEDGTVRHRLQGQLPGVEWRPIPRGWNAQQSATPLELSSTAPPADATATVPVRRATALTSDGPPLILDRAVKRMLRLAIASYKAVLLVGPPGTGKTTLLEEAVREAMADPASYGLSGPPKDMMVVTPEESWTTRELVGGETVDDKGRLRFTPGHVLRAIARDEWLALDEANRADLDRIFGALLTWLSGKSVTISSASGDASGAPVLLGWAATPESVTDGLERLETGVGEPISFLAGSDWRLLGTYNAVDAQRVFHLGQALGRRFTRVPVPPIDRKQFLQALQPRLETLPPALDHGALEDTLAGLYTAHVELQPPLGPAIFLAIPEYIARGLDISDTELDEPEDAEHLRADTAQLGDDSPVAGTRGPAARAAADYPSARAHDLLAEAYLLGAGTTLAGLDEFDLEALRSRVVDREGLLAPEQWDFIASMLPALA